MPWVLALLLNIIVVTTAAGSPVVKSAADLLWPLPRNVRCVPGSLPLTHYFKVTTTAATEGSAVAAAAARRYTELFAPTVSGGPAARQPNRTQNGSIGVSEVRLAVANASDALGLRTSFAHTISLGAATAGGTIVHIEAATPFGAVAALETFGQLLQGCTTKSGCVALACTQLAVDDAPTFQHRGLLIDAGRRHYPVQLVESLMEGMAMVRLNVLHLHFADYGNSEFEAFGSGGIRIESHRYPALTANLRDNAGNRLYYTQKEVRGLVAFGKLRGIRVIPELEQSGHASWAWPLRETPHSLKFCSNSTEDKVGAQLYDDPGGRARQVLSDLIGEFAPLFDDEVFHVGGDETAYVGLCTQQNTIALESHVLNTTAAAGKTPMIWWSAATTANLVSAAIAAGDQRVVINAWQATFTAVPPP
jgi:hexosaminidase